MENMGDSDSSVELIAYNRLSPNASSAYTGSSGELVGQRPSSSPVLKAVESPNVAAIITALNTMSSLNLVFANNGRDIVSAIPYRSSWYSEMPKPVDRMESTENEWIESVRVELQLLNAFLNGKFRRRHVTTGNLESLFRMKISRAEERYMEIQTIFKILSDIPDFTDTLTQVVDIDHEKVSVSPIPLEAGRYGDTLRNALDRVFWPQIVDQSDDLIEDAYQIPILEKTCDVIAIHCQQVGIQVDELIWPERYSEKFRELVYSKWVRKKELEDSLSELEKSASEAFTEKDSTIPDSLGITIESLSESGYNDAAEEISKLLAEVKLDVSRREQKSREINAMLAEFEDGTNVVPLDASTMTPYKLKAVILAEPSGDEPAIVTRSSKDDDSWMYSLSDELYELPFDKVQKSCRQSDNYIMMYEREKKYEAATLAPSVAKFIDNDTASNAANAANSDSKSSTAATKQASQDSVDDL